MDAHDSQLLCANLYSSTTKVQDFIGLSQPTVDISLNLTGQQLYNFNLFKVHIPDVFHPHISRIQGVTPNGNCDFRFVFEGIFDETQESLKWSRPEFAPRRYWMQMTQTRILIANAFGVIVEYFYSSWNAKLYCKQESMIEESATTDVILRIDSPMLNMRCMKKSPKVADESMFREGNGLEFPNMGQQTRQGLFSTQLALIYNIIRAPLALLSCLSSQHGISGASDGVWVSGEFAQMSEVNHLMVNDSMRYVILM
ncbi:hypothetical protein E3N88_34483 [Mikania micrantha]|uniref:Uncharacterized protein n=1 Tax=Mikania micrantha TaxID=192012 RepID=A0A5N6M0W5_9ASTR|nr:hypothetical protein E3N88_34483 [Mikania micrantha]